MVVSFLSLFINLFQLSHNAVESRAIEKDTWPWMSKSSLCPRNYVTDFSPDQPKIVE